MALRRWAESRAGGSEREARRQRTRGQGVAAQGASATIDIGHSTLTGNSVAFGAAQSGVLGSYQDNDTGGNGGLGATTGVLSLH